MNDDTCRKINIVFGRRARDLMEKQQAGSQHRHSMISWQKQARKRPGQHSIPAKPCKAFK